MKSKLLYEGQPIPGEGVLPVALVAFVLIADTMSELVVSANV